MGFTLSFVGCDGFELKQGLVDASVLAMVQNPHLRAECILANKIYVHAYNASAATFHSVPFVSMCMSLKVTCSSCHGLTAFSKQTRQTLHTSLRAQATGEPPGQEIRPTDTSSENGRPVVQYLFTTLALCVFFPTLVIPPPLILSLILNSLLPPSYSLVLLMPLLQLCLSTIIQSACYVVTRQGSANVYNHSNARPMQCGPGLPLEYMQGTAKNGIANAKLLTTRVVC